MLRTHTDPHDMSPIARSAYTRPQQNDWYCDGSSFFGIRNAFEGGVTFLVTNDDWGKGGGASEMTMTTTNDMAPWRWRDVLGLMTEFKRRQRMEGFSSAAAAARLSLPPPSSSVDHSDVGTADIVTNSGRIAAGNILQRALTRARVALGKPWLYVKSFKRVRRWGVTLLGATTAPYQLLSTYLSWSNKKIPRRQLPPLPAAISHHIHRTGSTTTGRPARDRRRRNNDNGAHPPK